MISIEFLINLIIGWTILTVLIGLFIYHFVKLIEEKEEFFNEIERHNRELGYKERRFNK